MLLALPGVTLYRVNPALSRGMTVMQHDIFSRGLTESFGTAFVFLVASYSGHGNFYRNSLDRRAPRLRTGRLLLLARRLFTPKEPITSSPNDDLIPSLLHASAPIALYDLLNIGIMRIDLYHAGRFVAPAPGVTLETLGIYAAAVELGGGLRKVSQPFTPIFTPVVARQIVCW